MKNKSLAATKRLSLSAVLSALSVIILYLGSIFDMLSLTAVALASVFVYFAVIEMGQLYPWMIFGATSFLALLLLPDKFAPICYLLFGGSYPILKSLVERKLPRFAQWLCKVTAFNIIVFLLIWISKYILMIPDESLELTWILYITANLAFFLYDVCMTKLITLYLLRLRKLFRVKKYFDS